MKDMYEMIKESDKVVIFLIGGHFYLASATLKTTR